MMSSGRCGNGDGRWGGKHADTDLHKGWGEMARGRMLNNKITENELVAGLSNDTSRLGFTWLISFCDVEGRVHGNPALVRAKLFPLRDDMTNDEMASYIREWAEAGLIEWYEDDTGRLWIQFPGFTKNQKGLDRRKEPASEIPPPTPEGKEKVRTKYVLSTYQVRTEYVPSTYQVQHKRTEQKRTEQKRNTTTTRASEAQAAKQQRNNNDATTHAREAETVEQKLENAGMMLNKGILDWLQAKESELKEHIDKLPDRAPGAGLMPDDWLRAAIDEAMGSAENGRFNLRYLDTILDGWEVRGFRVRPEFVRRKAKDEAKGSDAMAKELQARARVL